MLLPLLPLAILLVRPPAVSTLHTLSVHVDSPETYNALFHLFSKDLQWPVIYGQPWTPERKRRNYAGIWAGNVVLEICGPYAGESYPEGVRARLHGLTFRPHSAIENSLMLVQQLQILNKAIGKPEDAVQFLYVQDQALSGPTLAFSIMQVNTQAREQSEQGAARTALAESRGGPLGLLSLQEIHIGLAGPDAIQKWTKLLPESGWKNSAWQSPGGPRLRFSPGAQGEITAIVLRVESLAKASQYLKANQMLSSAESGKAELNRAMTQGVRIILTE